MADLISKIKDAGNTAHAIRAGAIPKVNVDSTSTSTAFTVTNAPGIIDLVDGVCIYITNNKIASAENCTLNVNGKGAKPIYMSNASSTRVTTQFALNTTCLFVYNSSRVSGGCWDLVVGYDTKVTQTLKSDDADYPLLGAPSGQTATTTTTACFSTGLTFNPTNRSLSCGWDNTASAYTGAGLSGNRGALTLKTYIEQSGGTTLTYQRSVVRTFPGKIIGDMGLLLSIDSGGLTIIGGGESATSLANLISDDQSASGATKLTPGGTLTGSYAGDSEQMIVSSDNHIFFITNCNTVADRKAVVLSSSLGFYPDTNETGQLGTSTYYWNAAYIKTINGNLVGNADTASKINTNAKIGDTNKPVYIAADGTVTPISYTIDKSVPSNAVFTDTTYTPQSLGFGYGTCSTAAATAAKAVTLSNYALVTNGIVSVKFTYDVPANATMNINSKGAKNIYFRGAKITAGVIKAGDVATFVYSSYYHLISIDRWGTDIGDINTVLEAVL